MICRVVGGNLQFEHGFLGVTVRSVGRAKQTTRKTVRVPG
jgi:hypothetical protein